MDKLEKVTKGLERCIEKQDTVANKTHGFNCTACPYFRKCDLSGYLIGLPLMRDALALLKAQEPGKVNITITQSDGWKEGNCPFCGMKVDSFYNWSFCGTCGRGLKWE